MIFRDRTGQVWWQNYLDDNFKRVVLIVGPPHVFNEVTYHPMIVLDEPYAYTSLAGTMPERADWEHSEYMRRLL